MTGIIYPDFARSIGGAMQLRQQEQQNAFQMDRARRADEADALDRETGQHFGAAIQGDKGAQARVMTNPKYALPLLQYLDKADSGARARLKEQFEATGKAAAGILALPDADQPAAYEAIYQQLTQQGYKINLPPRWSPALKGQLQSYAVQVPEYLKMLGDQPRPMGEPGGASAAAAPDVKVKGAEYTNYLQTKHGLSPIAAAGIVGGLIQESSLDPGYGFTRPGGDNGTAHGMGQWRHDRAQGLRTFAQAQGKAATDPTTQLDYLVNEMKGGDMGAQRAFSMLQQAKTPEEATTAMMHFFRPRGYTPNNPQGGHGYAQRVQYAQQVMPQPAGREVAYGGNAAPMPEPPAGLTPPGPPPAQMPGGPPGLAQGSDMPAADANGTPLPPQADNDWPTVRDFVKSKYPGAKVLGFQDGSIAYDKQGRVRIKRADGQNDAVEIPKGKDLQKPQGGGPFGGTSVEAQALNMLITNGTLSPQQAAELAAGKTITNPADGSVIFMTPSGLFGQKPGQPPQPVGAPGAAPPAGATPQPGSGMIPVTPPKPVQMTEGQSNAALYADRIREAEKIIAENEAAGLDPTGKLLEKVPGGNYLQSESYQNLEQARRNFINAVLRRESGAVISDAEFANAENQYFPRGGDKPEVLKQKAANRKTALEGISRAAGPAYKPQVAAQPAPAPVQQAAPQPPAPGTVVDGYLFKGGNPADQNNWSKVQ